MGVLHLLDVEDAQILVYLHALIIVELAPLIRLCLVREVVKGLVKAHVE